MNRSVLEQLDSFGFRPVQKFRSGWGATAAGLFADSNGQTHLILYSKLLAPAWPQYAIALESLNLEVALLRSSSNRVLIQTRFDGDASELIRRLEHAVRRDTSVAVFTPEFGFGEKLARSKPRLLRLLAPISLFTLGTIAFGLSNGEPTPAEDTVGSQTESLLETEVCLASLPEAALIVEAREFLDGITLPTVSEGELSAEISGSLLEISPEQTIGGMTLFDVKFSCRDNSEVRSAKFRSDTSPGGSVQIVEIN